MHFKTVGRTGIRVSGLCFGTMSFGKIADEEQSAAMFRRCRDAGINFFDCSNSYSAGKAEEILGGLTRGARDEVVLVSKVANPTGPDINDRGTSRRHVSRAVEASLRRLGTDRLDFYLLHRFDSDTPIHETLMGLDDLVRSGKVLHVGASNWAAWQMAKALGLSSQHGLARFDLIEPMYNLAKRQAEVEILPMALSEQVGVISYSPLAGGILTGKYVAGEKPTFGRIIDEPTYRARYGAPIYNEVAARFVAHARARGVDPASLAVAWVMAHPGVTAPIIGARNVEQLEPSLAAVDVAMTADWRAEISALSPTPPPATDRTELQAS